MTTLKRATQDDYTHAVETNGEATDPYKVKAAKMFGVDYARVTPKMRAVAKSVTVMTRYSTNPRNS